jgi:hypothetical protein
MASEPNSKQPGGDNQGEGDREAARHYNEATREFVKSGKVDDAAERASEQDPKEARRSEHDGKQRAREEDPAVHRDYDKPVE